MLRTLIGLTACVILCVSATAQTDAVDQASPAPPADDFKITNRVVVPQPPLVNQYRAEYLARQLDLTKEQREQYSGAVKTILLVAPPVPDLARVRILVNEMKAAEQAQDAKKIAEIRAELKSIGEATRTEPEFVLNVKKFLSPEQGRILDEQVARLARNPSGALRPIDVFDYLEANLSGEQAKQLAAIRNDFRTLSTKSARVDANRRSQLLRGLLRKCNAILNDTQQAEFKAFTERMRPDYVPNIEIMDGALNRPKKGAPKPAQP
jgi:Spy/CpxP family protein refolding chaperone